MTEPVWRSFRDGDLGVFAQVIQRYQDDVFAVALATVRDRALAEDVAQETFIAAYTHRDRLRDPAAIGGWLATIARNLGRDLLRAHQRERLVDLPDLDVASSGELPCQQLERATVRRQVHRALDRVPVKYREVLLLYYAAERSIASIAHSLGLSQAAALQRLSRGRKLVERHGASLRELVGDARLQRSFPVAVLALLALRSSARAAPSSASPRRFMGRARWGLGLVVMFAFVHVDDASGQRFAATMTPAPAPPQLEATVVPTPTATSKPVVAVVSAPPLASSLPPPPPRRSRGAAPATPPARPRSVATLVTAPDPMLPSLALETPCCACPTCASSGEPAPRRDASRWELVNGYLETAAMPDRGEISYETIALGMMLRAGISQHVAVHVGMIGMDVVHGTYRNAGLAFGGGLKIGVSLNAKTKLAVLAEGARNINVGSLRVDDEWIGRAYASATHGSSRWNITLSGGVVGTDQGTVRAVSPMVGVGSQVSWDDHLGFVFENQYFTRPYLGIDTTSVLAVRFRSHHLPDNWVGANSVRIDVGAMLVDKSRDLRALPWLQVALGW